MQKESRGENRLRPSRSTPVNHKGFEIMPLRFLDEMYHLIYLMMYTQLANTLPCAHTPTYTAHKNCKLQKPQGDVSVTHRKYVISYIRLDLKVEKKM